MGMVLTSTPISICLVAPNDNEFWVFDPHGNPPDRNANVERFDSLEDAANYMLTGPLATDEEIFNEAIELLESGQIDHPQVTTALCDFVPFYPR